MNTPVTYYATFFSPIGKITLIGSNHGLTKTYIHTEGMQQKLIIKSNWREDYEFFYGSITQINEYFAGTRKQFKIKMELNGTPFQLKVWRALQEIPYGTAQTYKQIATKIGKPNAVRAVGNANSKNPLAIVIPCHRVVCTSGKISGFAYGKETKTQLLQTEGVKIHNNFIKPL